MMFGHDACDADHEGTWWPVRNPFSGRRSATVPTPRTVPAPDVMAGMEYLDAQTRLDADTSPRPEVSIQGVDPQLRGRALVPRVSLVLAPGVSPPDSVGELLTRGRPGDAAVRGLTFDIRPYRDVLEARGGWNSLAQLVRDPSDRVANTAFRAAIVEERAGAATAPALESGDLDVDVCVVAEGDTVAARRRHELGRARLTVTPFIAESERLTRRLAEILGHPHDGAGRRSLEHALADRVAGAPLTTLLYLHHGTPRCAVPGAWATHGPPGFRAVRGSS